MEALLSEVIDQGQILTLKRAAYKLGIPVAEAEGRLRDALGDVRDDILCCWTKEEGGKIALTVGGKSSRDARIFSVQRKPASASAGREALNNSLDGARDALVKELNNGFLENAHGAVMLENLRILPSSSGQSVQERPSVKDPLSTGENSKVNVPPIPKPAQLKTTADFFKRTAPSLPSKSDGKKPDEVEAKVTKPSQDGPNEPQTKSIKTASPEMDLDEEESEVTSASDEESDEEGGEQESSPAKVAGRKPKSREVSGKDKPRKKRRVIEDDDEATEEKRKAREIRKESEKRERLLQRETEKELKLKRELEEKEEAKHDFLKHLGANSTPVAHGPTIKKKVLRTRTFVDEDGFEVTEDVMVEEDVSIEDAAGTEEPLGKRAKQAQSPQKETKSPAPHKQPSAKQASLISFFTKKPK
jgi:hypothetical protein